MQRQDINKHLGTELHGAQLHEMNPPATARVVALAAERGVLVFRGQRMGLEEQIQVARQLGPLHVHPLYTDAARPEALPIHTDERSTYANGDTWHSDLSWTERPPSLSLLRFDVMPPVGGDTAFVSCYAALDALSPALRALLAGLQATHRYRNVSSREFPSSVHPIIRTHPVTNRQALFVNKGYTEEIEGLPARESRALLDFLFAHLAEGVPFQCRVRWDKETVVLWDNRCTQHYASWDYYPETRSGWRVTIAGERPYLDRPGKG